MRNAASLLVALGAVAVAGCTSSSAGGAGGAGGADPLSYKQALGTAALGDIIRQVPRVLLRNQFEIERSDSSSAYLVIRSRWNDRYPLEDERDGGVTEARTRVVLTARARARSGGTADVRVVELQAENMVLMGDSTQWRNDFMTPMFRAYIDRIANELKTELLTGIRVY